MTMSPPKGGAAVVQSPALGETVLVGPSRARGVVKFAGTTQFAAGHWLGVELEEEEGKNDGHIGGHFYFECKPKHGLFVRATAVVSPSSPTSGSPRNGINFNGSPRSRKTRDAKDREALQRTMSEPAPSPKQHSLNQEEKAEVPANATDAAAGAARPGPGELYSDAADAAAAARPESARGTEMAAAARRELAEASEDHDVDRLRKAVPAAKEAGVCNSEIASAHRILNFEVQQSLLFDLEGVRAAVSSLSKVVEAAEARALRAERQAAEAVRRASAALQATAAKSPSSQGAIAKLADFISTAENTDDPEAGSSSLERQLWQKMEQRMDAAIGGAVSRATLDLRQMLADLAQVRKSLSGGGGLAPAPVERQQSLCSQATGGSSVSSLRRHQEFRSSISGFSIPAASSDESPTATTTQSRRQFFAQTRVLSTIRLGAEPLEELASVPEDSSAENSSSAAFGLERQVPRQRSSTMSSFKPNPEDHPARAVVRGSLWRAAGLLQERAAPTTDFGLDAPLRQSPILTSHLLRRCITTVTRTTSNVSATADAAAKPPESEARRRWKRAVRKVLKTRIVTQAWQQGSSKEPFSAEKAVGNLEASLAIEEEFANVMQRMGQRRTSQGAVGTSLAMEAPVSSPKHGADVGAGLLGSTSTPPPSAGAAGGASSQQPAAADGSSKSSSTQQQPAAAAGPAVDNSIPKSSPSSDNGTQVPKAGGSAASTQQPVAEGSTTSSTSNNGTQVPKAEGSASGTQQQPVAESSATKSSTSSTQQKPPDSSGAQGAAPAKKKYEYPSSLAKDSNSSTQALASATGGSSPNSESSGASPKPDLPKAPSSPANSAMRGKSADKTRIRKQVSWGAKMTDTVEIDTDAPVVSLASAPTKAETTAETPVKAEVPASAPTQTPAQDPAKATEQAPAQAPPTPTPAQAPPAQAPAQAPPAAVQEAGASSKSKGEDIRSVASSVLRRSYSEAASRPSQGENIRRVASSVLRRSYLEAAGQPSQGEEIRKVASSVLRRSYSGAAGRLSQASIPSSRTLAKSVIRMSLTGVATEMSQAVHVDTLRDISAIRASLQRIDAAVSNRVAKSNVAATRLQAIARGHQARQSVSEQIRVVKKLQRVARGFILRQRTGGGQMNFSNVVDLVRLRHSDTVSAFERARGEAPGLTSQTLVQALEFLPKITVSQAQIGALWAAFEEGAGQGQLMTVKTFISLTTALSEGTEAAAEWADVPEETWERLEGQR